MFEREGTLETTVHGIDEQTPISDLDLEHSIVDVAVDSDKGFWSRRWLLWPLSGR
jgi:hypothetical protein